MPEEIASPHPDQDGAGHAAAPASAATLAVLLIGVGEPVSITTRHLLASDHGIRSMEHALVSARETSGPLQHPDAVVLEVDARRDDAIEAVREAAARWRPAPLLVVTVSEDRSRNRQLVRAGARGVVTHSRQAEQLVSALHRVRDGEIWLTRSCLTELIDEMAASQPLPAHLATAEGLDRLTERERDVVALIAQGMHNKAIATELGITDHTVRHHLTAIFAKLGVADRLELAVYAFRHRDAGERPG